MAYAVISDRGKQYTVKPGERLRVHSVHGAPGDKLVFDKVLLLEGGEPGKGSSPEIPGARVEATLVRHGLDKKLIVFKKRRRKGYRRKQGHRQGFTEIRIDAVHGSSK